MQIISGGHSTSQKNKGIGPVEPITAGQSWPPKRLNIIGPGQKPVRTDPRQDNMIFDFPDSEG